MTRKEPSKRAEIFSRSVPDDRMFTIIPPLPITRDVPLTERLTAFKTMKQKIRDLARYT
jgi:hypothetical protein